MFRFKTNIALHGFFAFLGWMIVGVFIAVLTQTIGQWGVFKGGDHDEWRDFAVRAAFGLAVASWCATWVWMACQAHAPLSKVREGKRWFIVYLVVGVLFSLIYCIFGALFGFQDAPWSPALALWLIPLGAHMFCYWLAAAVITPKSSHWSKAVWLGRSSSR